MNPRNRPLAELAATELHARALRAGCAEDIASLSAQDQMHAAHELAFACRVYLAAYELHNAAQSAVLARKNAYRYGECQTCGAMFDGPTARADCLAHARLSDHNTTYFAARGETL